MSSSSSSSDKCCEFMDCKGVFCSHFNNWNLSSLTFYNSNECSIYAVFDYSDIDSSQTIFFYKSAFISDLVGIAQKSSSGLMNIEERNGSGLYGTVYWNGDPVYYPNYVQLICDNSSSSDSFSSSSSVGCIVPVVHHLVAVLVVGCIVVQVIV